METILSAFGRSSVCFEVCSALDAGCGCVVTSSTKLEQIVIQPFENRVREIAFRLRHCLVELSAAVDVDLSQPRGAARQLEIDKTLAWKISKVATGPDPVAAMSMLPGIASQKTLLKAFSKAAAPAHLIEQTRAALDEVQRLVEEHADDRETFGMMLGSSTPEGRRAREESQRKLAFQGNSAIWGVHCRVRTWTYVVGPSEDPELGDVGVFGGFVDVRRLRRDIPWTLNTIAALDEDGKPMRDNPIESLTAERRPFDGMPVLPEFCRGPVPPIERVLRADGVTQYRLTGGEVGNTGVFSWGVGWRYPRAVPRWSTEHHRSGEFALNVLIPAEAAQLDVFLHKEFWPELQPTVRVFSLLPGEPMVAHGNTDRHDLHVQQVVERLHEDPLDVAAHDVPNYRGLCESAFAAMGHKSTDFAGFRVRMRYPILSTSICMRVELQERPGRLGG